MIHPRPRPEPDADGLYDVDGVRMFTKHRRCDVEVKSDLQLVIFDPCEAPLTAISPGRWDAVSILKACSVAAERETYDVDASTAKPMSYQPLPYQLDGLKIARIVGAAGLKPYLTRPGQHRREGMDLMRPRPIPAELLRQGYVNIEPLIKRADPGMQTWPFLHLLANVARTETPIMDRALKALYDAGLINMDPKCTGFSVKGRSWTERAFMPKPQPRPVALAADDDAALEWIGAGLS